MKASINVLNDFLVVLDENKIIQAFIPDQKEFDPYIKQSYESLFTIEETQSKEFFHKLDSNQSIFNFKVILNFNKFNYTSYLNGFKDENYYIVVLFNHESDEEILKKIIKINSQQVNELRALKKDILKHDEKAYIEISKLNSELLNSQRIIEKQNIELKKFNQLLKKISIEDSLTGSYNRRYFYDYMRENVLPSQSDNSMGLVLIDFNHFKAINDQFGHDAGDRLLSRFVKDTQNILKEQGTIFRLGGDEFLILFNKCSYQECMNHMKIIDQKFKDHSEIASLAYGLVAFKESEINQEFDLTNLLKEADELMYIHKNKIKSDK